MGRSLIKKGNFMDFASTMDNFKKAASGAVDKGKDWYKKEMDEIENLAKNNTGDVKQKLLQKAQEHKVKVNENMEIGEIKNKIKAALRNKT